MVPVLSKCLTPIEPQQPGATPASAKAAPTNSGPTCAGTNDPEKKTVPPPPPGPGLTGTPTLSGTAPHLWDTNQKSGLSHPTTQSDGLKTDTTSSDRRLGSLESSDDLSVVQECFVGAFLLLLMFIVYLFTRRVTAPKAFGPNRTRIVRKKAPTFVRKLL